MRLKDEIVVASVFTRKGIDVCKVSIFTQMNIKDYSDMDIVFRDAMKNTHVLNIGGMMASYVYDRPELVDSNNGLYSFAFPFYGGMVVQFEFNGSNMDEYAYSMLQRNAALAVCDMVEIYFSDRYRNAANLEVAMHEVRTMRMVVSSEITYLMEKRVQPTFVAEIGKYESKLKELSR